MQLCLCETNWGISFNLLIQINIISETPFGIFLEVNQAKDEEFIKGGRIMKLAISAQGQTSTVNWIAFWRAKYFLLVDSEGGIRKWWKQAEPAAPQGAGIQAAQTVVEKGAQAVLTGNCGPKAFRVLQAPGSRWPSARGSIREVIQKFGEGKIQFAQEPNVDGHWG